MEQDNRTALRKAVDKLIAEGKIKQDKDLQQIFGLSKSTISAYLNNPKPGKRFIIDFEKKFGISLKEFEETKSIPMDNYTNKYIQKLEEDIQRLKDDVARLVKENECLKDDILFNLKKNHEFLKGMMAQIRGASLMAAMRSAGNDSKKYEQERRTLGKLIGEALTEQTETGKP